MPCNRCGIALEDDSEAKDQIWIDLFGESGELCDACLTHPVTKLKSLWHALWCKTCWEYHNWSDFKRWIKRKMVGNAPFGDQSK